MDVTWFRTASSVIFEIYIYFMKIEKNGWHFGYNFQIQKDTPAHQVFKDAVIPSKLLIKHFHEHQVIKSKRGQNCEFKIWAAMTRSMPPQEIQQIKTYVSLCMVGNGGNKIQRATDQAWASCIFFYHTEKKRERRRN